MWATGRSRARTAGRENQHWQRGLAGRAIVWSSSARPDRDRSSPLAGSIVPVNPAYNYRVEPIHPVDGIADADSNQPRSALAGAVAIGRLAGARIGFGEVLVGCDASYNRGCFRHARATARLAGALCLALLTAAPPWVSDAGAAARYSIPVGAQLAQKSTESEAVAARRAYARRAYKTAFTIWSDLAFLGDPESQNMMGVMYENGEGVAQDAKQAANWYRRAADKGNAEAQLNLVVLY